MNPSAKKLRASDRTGEPNLADLEGCGAGKRIHLYDFSNSVFGKKQGRRNLYDLSYNK